MIKHYFKRVSAVDLLDDGKEECPIRSENQQMHLNCEHLSASCLFFIPQ